jgi:hypothetical protein
LRSAAAPSIAGRYVMPDLSSRVVNLQEIPNPPTATDKEPLATPFMVSPTPQKIFRLLAPSLMTKTSIAPYSRKGLTHRILEFIP